MTNHVALSLAALVAAGTFGFGQPSRAQDFPLTIAGILCDTEAQVRSIVTANLQNAEAMRSAFQALNNQRNSQNQPVCSIEEIPHMLLSVPQSIDVGPWPENGQVLEAFILHIQVESVDAWFLYLAPGAPSGVGNSNRAL